MGRKRIDHVLRFIIVMSLTYIVPGMLVDLCNLRYEVRTVDERLAPTGGRGAK